MHGSTRLLPLKQVFDTAGVLPERPAVRAALNLRE